MQSEGEIRRCLAAQIAEWRRQRKWTQQMLAEHSEVPRSYIADLEGARRNPSVATLLRIANALRVPLNKLFEKPAAK